VVIKQFLGAAEYLVRRLPEGQDGVIPVPTLGLLGAQVLLKKSISFGSLFFYNFAPCEVVSPFFLNGDVGSATRERVA
jgi:hypothetical protein